MKTESQNNSVYDLFKLLNDICLFLEDELKYGEMTNKSKFTANKIIQNVKLHMKEGKKYIVDNDSGRYVDMKGTRSNTSEYVNEDLKISSDDNLQVYSAVTGEEHIVLPPPILEYASTCPYKSISGLSAEAICPNEFKTGILVRREKFFVFIEKVRKIYASVYCGWLLLYNNKNELKPFEFYDLAFYEAKKIEKKEGCFELVCRVTEKTYTFTAIDTKDLIQWTIAINTVPLHGNVLSFDKTNNTENQHQIVTDMDYEDQEYHEIVESAESKRSYEDSLNDETKHQILKYREHDGQNNIDEIYDNICPPPLKFANELLESNGKTFNIAPLPWDPRQRPIPTPPSQLRVSNNKINYITDNPIQKNINKSFINELRDEDDTYDVLTITTSQNTESNLKSVELVSMDYDNSRENNTDEDHTFVNSKPLLTFEISKQTSPKLKNASSKEFSTKKQRFRFRSKKS